MPRRIEKYLRSPSPAKHNSAVRAVASQRMVAMGKRARVAATDHRGPYNPPENWYEPSDEPTGTYRVVTQSPGKGYRFVVTEADVRERLAMLPSWMLGSLEVVQFSRMTRKKRQAPCYGMQWGNAIYLYPIEENLIEIFCEPPKPAQKIEAAMYGGRWEPSSRGVWKLVWTEETIRDFYLNNVLIHELGHILDNRNTSYVDRERYAEWFALEHGYKPSRRKELAQAAATAWLKKRHHK